MSEVHFYRPKMRLAKLLREPGGKTIAEAVNDARAGLDTLGAECLREVDDCLCRIETTFEALPPSFDADALRNLYRVVNSLVGLPGVAGLAEMERATYSLADLLDRMVTAGAFEREAARVHVQALRLLRSPDALGAKAVSEVLQGLGKVREKYKAAETEAAGNG
ncbi:MAG TPA: hypothetical protein VEA44_01845 [Caulobacter sp.]|nr:hypothetical protein [Caulobacter sp.]